MTEPEAQVISGMIETLTTHGEEAHAIARTLATMLSGVPSDPAPAVPVVSSAPVLDESVADAVSEPAEASPETPSKPEPVAPHYCNQGHLCIVPDINEDAPAPHGCATDSLLGEVHQPGAAAPVAAAAAPAADQAQESEPVKLTAEDEARIEQAGI